MIKKIRLKNWKSFSDATLHIDPLMIVIGTNASGKSNLLDALMFLHRISRGVAVQEAIEGDTGLPALRGGLEWVCLKPSKQFSLEVTIDGESQNEEYLYKITAEIPDAATVLIQKEELVQVSWKDEKQDSDELVLLTSSLAVDNLSTVMKCTVSNLEAVKNSVNSEVNQTKLVTPVDHGSALPHLERIFPEAEKISLVVRSVLEQLNGIFVFDPIPSHMRDYSRMSKKLDSDGSNIAGVLAQLISPQKEEIEKALASHLSVLPERDINKVWAEGVGKFNTDAMLYCEESWSEESTHTVDARGMSDGTLRYIAIVAALLIREEGSLMVIEEVDSALHPSRAHALLKMLKELGKARNIDVIVTTHNPALLDAAGPAMVPFITVAHRNNSSGESELKLFEDIENLPKLLAHGSLGRLSADGRIENALKQEYTQ